jgi:hypothetical protein
VVAAAVVGAAVVGAAVVGAAVVGAAVVVSVEDEPSLQRADDAQQSVVPETGVHEVNAVAKRHDFTTNPVDTDIEHALQPEV